MLSTYHDGDMSEVNQMDKVAVNMADSASLNHSSITHMLLINQ